jgi:copper ion binding protein
MIIEGMMCPHCQKAVTKALCSLEGVSADVSLADNAAYITSTGITSDEAMIQAVTDADYKVISLTDDKPTHSSKGATLMKKTMIIEGMMCPHCQKAVTKALNELEGVSATVSLEDKAAYITTDGTTSDEAMIKAVTDGDYKVISLTDAE